MDERASEEEMTPPLPVPADAVCVACGYGLAGLSAEGVCPECRTPIAESIRGSGLRAASAEYLGTLRMGAWVSAGSVLLDVVWFASFPVLLSLATEGVIPLSVGGAMRIVTVLDLLGTIVGLWGWWMLSAPNEAMAGRRDMVSRRLLRALLVAGAAWCLAQTVAVFVPAVGRTDWAALAGNLQFGPNTQWTVALITALVLRGVFLVLRFVRFWVGLVYLRSLAAAIPSAALHKRCTRQLWTIPLWSTLGMALFALGPVWAVWLYVRSLWLFGREFGEILKSRTY